MEQLIKKAVEESQTETTRLLRYQYLNSQRRLFGGALMQWIDELASIVAHRHSGHLVITAAVDSLEFRQPAYLGDMVVLNGRVTYTGTTSMEVKVNTYVEKDDGSRQKINQAYLVFVATDEDGKPQRVPGLLLNGEEEHREWAAGQKRYDLRKQRRQDSW